MNLRRHISGRKLRRAGRSLLAVVLALTLPVAMAPWQVSHAQIVNTATVNGTPLAGTLTPAASTESVDVENAAPALSITKTPDVISGVIAGQVITYTYVVTNTGNVTITGISVTDSHSGSDPDPVPGGETLTGDAPPASDSIDGGANGVWDSLAPGDEVTFTATYTVTAADELAGADLANTATANGTPAAGTLTPATANAVVSVASDADLVTEKTLASADPNPSEGDSVTFLITVTDNGPAQASNVNLTDLLPAGFYPTANNGTVSQGSYVSGTGVWSVGNILSGNSATLTLEGIVNYGQAGATLTNTTTAAVADQNDPDMATDDLTESVTVDPDTDGDGSPDGNEGCGTDRDGDGIADCDDYDPTGYLYCEEDGRILPGGSISVTGPLGSNSSVGTANGITIVRNGSGGRYQFHILQPGSYTLSISYPPSGVASTARLPSGSALDVTSLLPADPGILGSGETGSTGVLADFSTAANQPFYVTFEFEAGDPQIFNNNIPLRFCSLPELTTSKIALSGPTIQPDDSTLIVYRVGVENTGLSLVENVQLTDNLVAAFGAGNFTVTSATLFAGPAGATINGAYDGDSDTGLLLSPIDLLPGEQIFVDIDVTVTPPVSGTYTNSIDAAGTAPLDGSPVTDSASLPLDLVSPSAVSGLVAVKTANRSSIRLGERVTYTIEISNNDTVDRTGIDLVDIMPAGFTYMPGSAVVGLVAQDPVINGRELVWPGQTIVAGGSVTVTLTLAAGANIAASEFTNRGFARDGATGNTVSNVATATVRYVPEPVFDCGDVIGKVFDDKNRNGYPDPNEPGLPGVRLATVRGLLITTDKFGRFHITCAMIPDRDIGSNFILKLDPRTMPTGYRVTTENPRVVRLTRGKISKLNFGASVSRVVRLDLTDDAFVPGKPELKRRWLEGIDRLVEVLDAEISTLRMTYTTDAARDLARDRLNFVADRIRRRWQDESGRYELVIERQFVEKN